MKNLQQRTIIIALLILLSQITFAQSKVKVGVSMGPVFPLGSFSSTNSNSLSAGYSETGFNLAIDADYFLHNRFALSAKLFFGTTTIDADAFSVRLNNELAAYMNLKNSENKVNYDINYWQWSSPLVGAKYNYPISINKIYVEVGAYSGVNFTQIPDQNLSYLDSENSREIISQNDTDKDISIPLSITCGVRFKINEKMQLRFNADYFYTKANYSHVNYIKGENANKREEISVEQFSVPIQTISATVGLVYVL